MVTFTIVLINIDIYGLTCPAQWERQANILRSLSFFEKYESNIYDVRGMRRYIWNMLQWYKSNLKSMKITNGDYCILNLVTSFMNVP